MTRTHRDEYRQRSIVDAVFGAIKKMYGNHLRISQVRPTEPEGCNPGHLLQRQSGRALASKRWQAHARVAHCNGCVTGAVVAAPSVGEPCAPSLGSDEILRFRTDFEAGDMRKMPQSQKFEECLYRHDTGE